MLKSSRPFHIAIAVAALVSLAGRAGWLQAAADFVSDYIATTQTQRNSRPATQIVIVRAEAIRSKEIWRRWHRPGTRCYRICEVIRGPAELIGRRFTTDAFRSRGHWPLARPGDTEVFHLNYAKSGAVAVARRFAGAECFARERKPYLIGLTDQEARKVSLAAARVENAIRNQLPFLLIPRTALRNSGKNMRIR